MRRIPQFILALLVVGLELSTSTFATAQPVFRSVKRVPAIQNIAVAPDGSVYGIATRQIYHSIDRGATWERLPNTDLLYAESIYIDKAGDFFVLGVSGFYFSRGGPDHFVLQSDRGTGGGLGMNIRFIKDNYIVIDIEQAGNVMIESFDTGKTWAVNYDISWYRVSPSGTHYRFSGVTWSRSIDEGANWTSMSASYGRIFFGPDDYVLIMTETDLEITSNGGTTWLKQPLHKSLSESSTQFWMDKSKMIYAMTPKGYFNNSFYGTLFQSTDMGASWDSVKIPGAIYFGVYTPWDQLWVSAGSLYSLENGGLTQISAMPNYIQSMAFAPNKTWAIGSGSGETSEVGMRGIFSSTDDGITWAETNQPSVSSTANSIEIVNDRVFVSLTPKSTASSAGVFLSTDQGISWTENLLFTSDTVVTRLKRVSDNILLAGTNRAGIYRSEDGGSNWQLSNDGITNGEINAIVEDGFGRVFLGTDDGVFLSTDAGRSWSRRDLREHNPKVYGMAVDRQGIVYAATAYGLLRSADLQTWTKVYVGLTDFATMYLAIDSGQGLYTGYYYKFFAHHSGDNGTVWNQIIPVDDNPFYLQGFWTAPSGFVYASGDGPLLRTEKKIQFSSVRFDRANSTKAIHYSENGLRLNHELTGEITITLYDQVGRNVCKLQGDVSVVEGRLNEMAQTSTRWYAYRLETRSELFKGILQF